MLFDWRRRFGKEEGFRDGNAAGVPPFMLALSYYTPFFGGSPFMREKIPLMRLGCLK